MGYILATLAFIGFALAAVPLRHLTVPIPTAVCFGYAVGALVMLSGAKREGMRAFVAFARTYPWRVALQLFAYTSTTLTYHWSIKLTTVANAALTHSLQPIFTCFLFVPLLYRSWPSKWTLVSVALGFGGLYLALYDKLRLDTSILGIVLGTASAVTYSISLMQLRFFTSRLEQRSLMGSMMSMSFLLMLPFAIAEGGEMPDLRGLLMLLAYALLAFALANGLFFSASKRLSQTHLAVLGYIEPVAAIAVAALFLQEPLTMNSVLGGVLVISSGALLAFDRARKTAA